MFSKKLLFSGAIFLLVVILYLIFPSRLPIGSTHHIAPQQVQKKPEISNFKTVQYDQLYVAQNFGRGQFLQLSDGTYFEVMPHDRRAAAYWATPSPIDLCFGEDEDYPLQITNVHSRTMVRVKETSYDEIQEKIEQMKLPKKEATFPAPLPPEQIPQPGPAAPLPHDTHQTTPKPAPPIKQGLK